VNKLQRRRSWESVSHLRAWTSLRLWVLIGLVSREILKVERKFSSSLEAEYCLWRRASERFWSTMTRTSSNRMPSAHTKVWKFTFSMVMESLILRLSVCLRVREMRHGAQLDSMVARYFLVVSVSTKKERSGQIFPRNLREYQYIIK
jgi:hypothetical protein